MGMRVNCRIRILRPAGLLQHPIDFASGGFTRTCPPRVFSIRPRRNIATIFRQHDDDTNDVTDGLASFVDSFEHSDGDHVNGTLHGSRHTMSRTDIRSQKKKSTARMNDVEGAGDLYMAEGTATTWREKLEKSARLRGVDGMLSTWLDMEKSRYMLPTEGSDADSLWTQLLNASIAEKQSPAQSKILDKVLAHAEILASKDNSQWPGLYSCIIGRWLRVCPERATDWHLRLINLFSLTRVDLRPLANACAFSRDPFLALESFRVIHAAFPGQSLYDSFILELLNYNHKDNVIEAWHHHFVAQEDGPSAKTAALPEVKRLTDLSFAQMAEKATADQAQADFSLSPTPFTRASMSTLVGDVHGIKPKEISDGFVAKLLATRAFSLDIILAGLGFFSISKLGPSALRELALRTTSSADFRTRLYDLEQKGISPDESIYSVVIGYISDNEFEHLFKALLARDQHPDDMDNIQIQSALLYEYLRRDDMANAHLSLIILSMIDSRGNDKAWNVMLQYYAKNGDHKNVESVARRMRTAAIPASRRSLTFLHRYVLTARSPSKRPVVLAADQASRYFSSLDFTTIMYIHAAKHGVEVHPQLWVENLKRYGMLGDWNNLERLIWWLYSWYSHGDRPDGDVTSSFPRESDEATLRAIFTKPMLTALVVWGMRAPSQKPLRMRQWTRGAKARRAIQPLRADDIQAEETAQPAHADDAPRVLPWARGIALLHQIETKYSVPLAHQTAHALIDRLWVLFGPAFSTRQRNLEAITHNRAPIMEYLQHANDIWGGKLYNLDAELLKNNPESWSDFLVGLFGSRRSTKSTIGEFADVQAWASDLVGGRRMALGRTVAENAYLWRHSPYRIVRSDRSRTS